MTSGTAGSRRATSGCGSGRGNTAAVWEDSPVESGVRPSRASPAPRPDSTAPPASRSDSLRMSGYSRRSPRRRRATVRNWDNRNRAAAHERGESWGPRSCRRRDSAGSGLPAGFSRVPTGPLPDQPPPRARRSPFLALPTAQFMRTVVGSWWVTGARRCQLRPSSSLAQHSRSPSQLPWHGWLKITAMMVPSGSNSNFGQAPTFGMAVRLAGGCAPPGATCTAVVGRTGANEPITTTFSQSRRVRAGGWPATR